MKRDFSFSEQRIIFVIGVICAVGIIILQIFVGATSNSNDNYHWSFYLLKFIAFLMFVFCEAAIFHISKFFLGKVLFDEKGVSVITKKNKILRFIKWEDVYICNVSTNINTSEQFICISANKNIKQDHTYWPGVALSPIYFKGTIALPADFQLIAYCDHMLEKHGKEISRMENPRIVMKIK